MKCPKCGTKIVGTEAADSDEERFSTIEDPNDRQYRLTLTRLVEAYPFLEVIDDASMEGGLSVFDARIGLCVVVEHPGQLEELVEKGAEWYLGSEYNGCRLPVKYAV